MKLLLALVVLLGATQTWACEEIAGNWNCEGNLVSLSFETVNGKRVLHFQDKAIPAENINVSNANGTIQVQCVPNLFQMTATVQRMTAETKFELRNARKLALYVKVSGFDQAGNRLHTSEKIICRR